MKLRILAYAAILGCALGATSATAQREAREQNLQQNSATALHAFVDKWQQRILSENLPVADAQNWGVRNMAKFASLSAERLDLAMKANSIGELEALLVSAPIPNGMNLALLAAMKPGNISLSGMVSAVPPGAVEKKDPTTDPTLYADLVFTALNPCRIFDSRPSQGGSGILVNGVSRIIQIGPFNSYTFQGGSATSCGMTTLAAVNAGEIAAVMVAASSFSQTGAGYLTFYSATTADPSASVVSMFYAAGSVQTSFVVMPTDLITSVFSRGISRNANTDLAIDIVGYFAKPKAVALECVDTAPTTNSVAAGANGQAFEPACAAGFTKVGITCETGAFDTVIAGFGASFSCVMHNNAAIARNITAVARCCRVPGR